MFFILSTFLHICFFYFNMLFFYIVFVILYFVFIQYSGFSIELRLIICFEFLIIEVYTFSFLTPFIPAFIYQLIIAHTHTHICIQHINLVNVFTFKFLSVLLNSNIFRIPHCDAHLQSSGFCFCCSSKKEIVLYGKMQVFRFTPMLRGQKVAV